MEDITVFLIFAFSLCINKGWLSMMQNQTLVNWDVKPCRSMPCGKKEYLHNGWCSMWLTIWVPAKCFPLSVLHIAYLFFKIGILKLWHRGEFFFYCVCRPWHFYKNHCINHFCIYIEHYVNNCTNALLKVCVISNHTLSSEPLALLNFTVNCLYIY